MAEKRTMTSFSITRHAVARYRERGPQDLLDPDTPDDSLRDEIDRLLLAAKPRDQRAAKKKTKNTTYVRTPVGFFIASRGHIVSFIDKPRSEVRAYGYADGLTRFVLPCCEYDIGITEVSKRMECPVCGTG